MARARWVAIHEWVAHGLDCAIAASPGYGLTGYVRLPDGHQLTREQIDTLDVHGGVTYGPDNLGWIGFDTQHLGDAWLVSDLPAARVKEVMRKYKDQAVVIDSIDGRLVNDPERAWTLWTRPALERETERLASEIRGWIGPAGRRQT